MPLRLALVLVRWSRGGQRKGFAHKKTAVQREGGLSGPLRKGEAIILVGGAFQEIAYAFLLMHQVCQQFAA